MNSKKDETFWRQSWVKKNDGTKIIQHKEYFKILNIFFDKEDALYHFHFKRNMQTLCLQKKTHKTHFFQEMKKLKYKCNKCRD